MNKVVHAGGWQDSVRKNGEEQLYSSKRKFALQEEVIQTLNLARRAVLENGAEMLVTRHPVA